MKETREHTCSQWNYGARWTRALRVLADIIEALEHPSDGAIASTNQDLIVGYLPEHVQTTNKTETVKAKQYRSQTNNLPWKGTTIVQIEDLIRIQ